jgi:hypothetical protein
LLQSRAQGRKVALARGALKFGIDWRLLSNRTSLLDTCQG